MVLSTSKYFTFTWLTFLYLLITAPISTWAQTSDSRILIYSATAGFRHDSIPTAINALLAASSDIRVSFDTTEDISQFTDDNLSSYDAIIMLSTTGEVLDTSGKSAFQSYLNKGGNFVAIHSASDCLINDEFYRKSVGAYFSYHPEITTATVNVLDLTHPSTAHLPTRWEVRDEMYNFKSDPRAVGATILLSADESTYNDNNETSRALQGTPHPTAWYQEHNAGVSAEGFAGRSFYTSLGHLNETWQDNNFISHVLGGITWALDSNTTLSRNSTALVGHSTSTSNSNSSNPPESTSSESDQASGIMPSSLLTLLLIFIGSSAFV